MDIKIHVEIPAIEKLADAIMRSGFAGPIEKAVTAIYTGPEPCEGTDTASTNIGDVGPQAGTQSTTGFVDVPVSEVPETMTKDSEEPAETKKEITLELIMKTTAQMRDDGLMPQLRGLIGVNGPYGIRMVSQLKPEQYEAFAEDLRKLGGKI